MKPAPTMTEMLSELPWLVAAATMTGTSGSSPAACQAVARSSDEAAPLTVFTCETGPSAPGLNKRTLMLRFHASSCEVSVSALTAFFCVTAPLSPGLNTRALMFSLPAPVCVAVAPPPPVAVAVATFDWATSPFVPGASTRMTTWPFVASLCEAFDVEAAEPSPSDDAVAPAVAVLVWLTFPMSAGVPVTIDAAWLSTPLCEDVATAVADASSLPPLFVAVAVAVESFDCETEGTSVGPPPCWPPAVLTSTVLELPAPDWLADAPLCAFWEPPFATPAELPSSLDGCWLFVAVAVAEASFCWETPCSPPCPAEPLAGVLGAGGTTTTIVVVFCAWLCAVSASLSAF